MLFNLTISTPSPLIALGTLVFNGTAVWLNGASVAANIPYATVLDGGALQWGTTAGNGPANLFAATDLASSASHNVSIMPASILDSVVVQMDLSADTEMTIDDSVLWNMGPSINVQGSWVANECLGSGRVNGTCHTSEGSGSVLTYEFQGDAITVWGSLENSRARYSYSIDGGQALSSSSNANFTSSRPSTVLAHASNLGSGNHYITITSSPLDNVSRLEIDYIQIYTTNAVPAQPYPGSSDKPQLSHTAKIAIIVGSVAGCVLIAGGFLLVLLIRQKRREAQTPTQNQPSFGHFDNSTAPDSIFVQKTKEYDMETLASTQYSMASTKHGASASFHPFSPKNGYSG